MMADFKNNLEKSIFATLVYFDIFDYPLTAVEIWKWLFKISDLRFQISDLDSRSSSENQKLEIGNVEVANLADIKKYLEYSETLRPLIDSSRGFYFLRGRENLVEIRQGRYKLAEKKFKKALRISRFLKLIPGVKMVAVCNDLAWSNAPEESDIDFFVVVAPRKIWFVRFWAAGFLKIFGLRPSRQKTKDKICLSFFAGENHLNLESIAVGQPDIYLIYWIAQLLPIYDSGGIYEKFIKANAWVKKYLPNFFEIELSERRYLGGATLPTWLGVGEKFFRWLQMKLMPENLKKMANRDSRVIVNDSILKFHVNDRREEYKKIWEEKLCNFKISN